MMLPGCASSPLSLRASRRIYTEMAEVLRQSRPNLNDVFLAALSINDNLVKSRFLKLSGTGYRNWHPRIPTQKWDTVPLFLEALWISALQVSFRWSCSWGMLACNWDSQRSPVPNLRDTSYYRCPLISTKGQAALLGSIPGSVLFHLSLIHSYTATCCLQLDGRYQLVGIQHLLVNPSGGDPDKN